MIEDYNRYQFSNKEKILYLLEGLVLSMVIGWTFYKNILGVLLMSLIIPSFLKRKKEKLVNKRKWQLSFEFRDGIQSMAAALVAGYSVENAIKEALEDLSHLYQKDAYIIKEFTYLANQLQMNISVEEAFNDLGKRSKVDDIVSFAEVFSTAKRAGGNLVDVIKTSTNIISDKISIKEEVLTLMIAKKKEAQLMKIIPFVFLIYLFISNPGFLDPLYNNALGILIMSILLLFYFLASWMIDKIVNIEL